MMGAILEVEVPHKLTAANEAKCNCMSIVDAHFANSGKSQKVGKVAIVADGDAFRILLQYCPDIGGWPKHWFYEESDLAPGRLIVEFFKPFLLHLLAKKTCAVTATICGCRVAR